MVSEQYGPSTGRWVVMNLVMNVVLWGVALSYLSLGDGMRFTNTAVAVGCLIVCSVGWLMLLYKMGRTAFTGRTVALLLLLLNIGFALVLAWDLSTLHDAGPPG